MARASAEARAPAATNAGTRFVIATAAFAVFVLGAHAMRGAVEERLAFATGEWDLAAACLPEWLAEPCRSELQVLLSQMPERVSMRSAFWREELRAELEALPWIERVTDLARSGETISFEAEFLRPIVAIRSDIGHLLVDSRARVIAHVEGEFLARKWRVPEFTPHTELASRYAPGESLQGEEFEELFSILRPVADAGALERWPGAIGEISADCSRDRDRFWILHLAHGTPVEWGRAPNSQLSQTVAAACKFRSLLEVLSVWQDLEGAAYVELWVEERALVAAR